MKTSRLGYFEAVWLACSAFPLVARPAEPPAPRGAVEPDYRTATQWWSELRKKWTPLGWKNHLFRYNVLFNGAVVAEPNMNRRTARWAGQGVLVWPSSANPADDGTIRQGWSRDHDAPVLWTDWSGPTDANAKASRVSLRQQVFAHIPGAADVITGIEPLFAWARVSIEPRQPKAELPKKCEFTYKLYGPTISRSMVAQSNLSCSWAPYPRKLSFRAATPSSSAAIVEPDGKIRLAVARQKGCKADCRAAGKESMLRVEFDCQPGNFVDILIPMVPTGQDVIETECLLGYDGALAQADAYWHRVPTTAAAIASPGTRQSWTAFAT